MPIFSLIGEGLDENQDKQKKIDTLCCSLNSLIQPYLNQSMIQYIYFFPEAILSWVSVIYNLTHIHSLTFSH